MQNIRRGHYELGVEVAVTLRVMAAFDALALGDLTNPRIIGLACLGFAKCNNARQTDSTTVGASIR